MKETTKPLVIKDLAHAAEIITAMQGKIETMESDLDDKVDNAKFEELEGVVEDKAESSDMDEANSNIETLQNADDESPADDFIEATNNLAKADGLLDGCEKAIKDSNFESAQKLLNDAILVRVSIHGFINRSDGEQHAMVKPMAKLNERVEDLQVKVAQG